MKKRHLNHIMMFNYIWNPWRITMYYRHIWASRINLSAFQLTDWLLITSAERVSQCVDLTVHPCSGEDACNMEGFTFDTKAEDLRHVWIPLTLKMSISKSQGLEISSWPEGEEVREKDLLLISGLNQGFWVFIFSFLSASLTVFC